MALWTPYIQDVPLDLSVRAVKVDPVSPVPASTAPPQLEPLTFADLRYNSMYPYQPVSYQPVSYQPVSYQPVSYAAAVVPSTSPESTAASQLSNGSDFFDTESLSDDQEYQIFEQDALRAMAEKNGGSLLGNNPRMRRAVQASQTADDSYRKQRERNNYAAKQSRDRRKLRELRLALKVSFLEKKKAALLAALSARVCGRCRQTRES
ncbi:hypothetical protein PYW08_011487 [Mythimna loreyi]|uniref:Uncharacterized protein n=1 Tax=Mythimna loreyi TaxID=667449 RepID=A0ACC2QK00_9NEOP|nr:hypothetical protein PYW08_011487 [Mythimna loreyi]